MTGCPFSLLLLIVPYSGTHGGIGMWRIQVLWAILRAPGGGWGRQHKEQTPATVLNIPTGWSDQVSLSVLFCVVFLRCSGHDQSFNYVLTGGSRQDSDPLLLSFPHLKPESRFEWKSCLSQLVLKTSLRFLSWTYCKTFIFLLKQFYGPRTTWDLKKYLCKWRDLLYLGGTLDLC